MKIKLLFAFAACALSLAPALAQPGSFDTTFGTGGKVTYGGGSLSSMELQQNGKIVAVGHTDQAGPYDKFTLTRFNADGSIDSTFGDSGTIYTLFGAKCGSDAIAIQPDGKIVAVGYTSDSTTNSGNYDFMVVRYNADGTIDTTFGSDGIYTLPLSGTQIAHAVGLQPDGKVLVAGQGLIIRLSTDGVLDVDFNSSGIITIPGTIQDMKVLSDGSFFTGSGFRVRKYNQNGTIDINYGIDGQSENPNVPGSVSLRDFAVSPTGEIVVVGQTLSGTYKAGAAMFNADGTVKTSFGTDGYMVDTNLPSGILSHGNAVVILNDIIYIGYGYGPAGNYDFKIAAFDVEGNIVENFGTDGSTTFYFTTPTAHDYLRSIILQPDGKLLIGGRSMSANGSIVIARLHTEASLAMQSFELKNERSIVYPNPVTASSKLLLNVQEATAITLNLYNVTGQLVKTLEENTTISAGKTELPLNLGDICQGIYVLEVMNGNKKISSHRIVK